MLWCAMCRMVYVYATLSSLALSSQPVCAWVGWHRCLTVYTYAHIVQTIASHLSSLSLLLYILYNIYTTTIHIPNMIFVYIILCHVKRLCYTPTLVYTTAILYVYVCYTHCDIWLCTIISHTTLIYYTITIIITIILIYFYFLFLLLCCCMCVYACMCCAVLSLSCVYVCSLVCPRICSYMCVCVCLPRITLPDRAVVKRLMCWYRGVYFGKKFLQNLENGYTT